MRNKCCTSVIGVFRRVVSNLRVIVNTAWKAVSSLYTIIGFLSVWISFSDYIPAGWSFCSKALLSILILIGIFLLCFIISTICVLKIRSVEVVQSNSNHKVFVQYGDVYSPAAVSKGYSQRRNVVVSVNRCFDTIIDDDLVSENSQHGRIMKQFYEDGLYDESSLNQSIQDSLHNRHYLYEDLTVSKKPKGNTYRYETGAVAEIPGKDNVVYFLLGLSKFDSNYKASTSKEEFTQSIQKLIEFCNMRSQGYPVILPLIGSELARTGISPNNILRYLVQALKINKDIINCDFHIVVWEGDKEKIAISDL